MFIEVRNIFLRWFFYNFFNVLGFVNRVMYHPCAPSVTPFHPREIHRISSLPIAHIHAISQMDRIATYTPLDETRSIVALRDGHRSRAAATHARKEYCSQAQCQDENR